MSDHSPQIRYDMTWDQTRAAAIVIRRLTVSNVTIALSHRSYVCVGMYIEHIIL
jgi:hypothetical protein